MSASDQDIDFLQGIGVLVTRPVHQAQTLCEPIEAAAGTAIRFPTLQILPARDPESVTATLAELAAIDMAVFVSANAVEGAWQVLAADGFKQHLGSASIAAMGKQTANRLADHGIHADLTPPAPHNTESLLAMPALAELQSQQIVIFRGESGRETLADELRRRGARVTYAAVYDRCAPPVDAADPGKLIQRWQCGEVNVVTATSNETLQNLYDMLGEAGRELLLSTPLIVMSQRAVSLAQQLGFQHTAVIAKDASALAMMQALRQWRHLY